MTREEAIDVLNLRKDLHEETAKALDMAIEALSADAVEVKAEQLQPKVPPEWINEGMVLVPKHDWIEMQKKLEEYASAEAKTVGDMGEVMEQILIDALRMEKSLGRF